jgi:hypothetical protein
MTTINEISTENFKSIKLKSRMDKGETFIYNEKGIKINIFTDYNSEYMFKIDGDICSWSYTTFAYFRKRLLSELKLKNN